MPDKIANLRTLKGMGILADRAAQSPSLDLKKLNLIYGFNGSGKTTLSRLFASLENGELHPGLPAGSAFEISMEDGSRLGCPSNPTGLEKRLLVFNGDFIESNFQWAQGKANPVFFIGADQAEAAKALATLEAQIPQLSANVTATENSAKQADKAFGTFKKDRAKNVAPRLYQGSRKYEAPQLTKDYENWCSDDIATLDDDALKAAEGTRRLAEPMPKIDEVVFEATNIGKAFKFIRDICTQELSTVALEEVQQHPDMLLWLKTGHEYHDHNELNDCLFCGNKISSERLSNLKNALDNKIDEFVSRLTKTADRLQAVRADLDGVYELAPSLDAFPANLQSEVKERRTALKSALKTPKEQLKKLNEVLSSKQSRPASPAGVSQLPSQTEVEQAATQIQDALVRLNEIIGQHNQIVTNFEKHRDEAGILIRKHFLAECKADFAAHIQSVESTKTAHEAAQTALTQANKEAEELRQKIRTHGPAADIINKLVSSYLGHNELTILSVDEGYELQRYGRSIEGMPSEGEKTAIAISYFLSRLESEGRKLKDLIVVIDDPVSSLDTKALNYACSLIRSRLSKACQLIVLTHNQQCLNEFRKAWKNKARTSGDAVPTASFLFIDTVVPEGQTKRISSLTKMSKLLREYDSEYHFLFHYVLNFSNAAESYSEHGYMMPNVLRRVLDIFLAFKCPGSSGLSGKIEEICRHFPELNQDRMNALERLTQVESHSDNLDDLVSFSSMTLEETKEATSALLEMMEHVDERHTTSLKRICR